DPAAAPRDAPAARRCCARERLVRRAADTHTPSLPPPPSLSFGSSIWRRDDETDTDTTGLRLDASVGSSATAVSRRITSPLTGSEFGSGGMKIFLSGSLTRRASLPPTPPMPPIGMNGTMPAGPAGGGGAPEAVAAWPPTGGEPADGAA